MMFTALLAFAAGASLHAQSVLRPGDSITWNFLLQYSSTEAINSPDQPFGGYVMLDYSHVSLAGSLDYRLDFFEDPASPEPILSFPVHHLTGLHDQTGMPLLWVPEFSPPPDAWSDLDGMLRLTIVSGEMKNATPYISMLVPTSPGLMDYYQAVIVPEPGTLALLGLCGLLVAQRFRGCHLRP
jgi:hypothetical protein